MAEMLKTGSFFQRLLTIGLHSAIGFVTGYIFAFLTLLFLGIMPNSNDLSQIGLAQQTRALWLTFYIACGMGVLVPIVAKIRISRFWLCYCIVFGLIAAIPVWPGKSSIVGASFQMPHPFATIYISSGISLLKIIFLSLHMLTAFVVSLVLWSIWPKGENQNNVKEKSVAE